MHQEVDPRLNGETEPFETSGYPLPRGSGPLTPPPDYFQQPPASPPGWTPRPKVTVGNWLTILTLVLGFVGMAYTFGSSQATTNNRLTRLEDDVHQINAFQSTEHLTITIETTGGLKVKPSREVIQVPRSQTLKPSGQDFKLNDLDTRGFTIPPDIKR
jgi:hypothetical protein